MRTIAIINQKGGSGKTTTAINLAAALARRSQRTLLVDMDPQGHCALGVAIPEEQIELQVGDALISRPGRALDLTKLIWQVSRDLELIPSTTKLAGVEAARGGLAEREDRDLHLASFLTTLESRYDFCIVDCSPSIGLLTFNALRASQEVLIPVETGYFALQGASKQVATIRALCRRFGVRIPYRILPTMHEAQSGVARDILDELRTRFEKQMLDVVIRHDLKLKEAASLGVPVLEHDIDSKGARDYDELSKRFTDAELRPAYDEGEPMMGLPTHQVLRGGPRIPNLLGQSHATIEPAPPAPDAVPMTRAAELAARTRRLAMRTAQLNENVERDPDVAETLKPHAGMAHNAPVPSPVAPPQPVNAEVKSIPSLHRVYGAQATGRGLLFTYPAGPQAAVFVAGDHNGWSTTATPLRFNEQVGLHEACVPVPAGVYKYRLIINGQWLTDPHNPRTEPNPFGGHDSVVVVPPIDRAPQQTPANRDQSTHALAASPPTASPPAVHARMES